MINQQLLDYVRTQRSAGLSKEAIIQALSAGGWTANDVNEAFMAIEGVKTPPPAPPPPQPMGPRTIVPPPGAPAAPPPPLNSAPAPRPALAATEFSTSHIKIKRRGGILKWLVLLLILILVAVGGIIALAFINRPLVASYIPAIEMFFPPAPAAESTAPIDTMPLQTTPIEGTPDVSTTTSSSTVQ